jgi:hypothetical protein
LVPDRFIAGGIPAAVIPGTGPAERIREVDERLAGRLAGVLVGVAVAAEVEAERVTDIQQGTRVGLNSAWKIRVLVEVIAILAENRITVVIFHGNDCAPALPFPSANELEAVTVAALGRGADARGQQVAVEPGLGDDVDHAGHRVRAVNGRGAARKYLDTLDGGHGYLLQVDEIALPVIGEGVVGNPAAVQQDQRAARTEATQAELWRSRRKLVGDGFRLAPTGDLRHGVQGVEDRRVAFHFDLLGSHYEDRAGALDLGLLDARTGHYDSVELSCANA